MKKNHKNSKNLVKIIRIVVAVDEERARTLSFIVGLNVTAQSIIADENIDLEAIIDVSESNVVPIEAAREFLFLETIRLHMEDASGTVKTTRTIYA